MRGHVASPPVGPDAQKCKLTYETPSQGRHQHCTRFMAIQTNLTKRCGCERQSKRKGLVPFTTFRSLRARARNSMTCTVAHCKLTNIICTGENTNQVPDLHDSKLLQNQQCSQLSGENRLLVSENAHQRNQIHSYCRI